MTDLITRARKEWGYPDAGIYDYLPGPQRMTPTPCPPEVVAALLVLLHEAIGDAYCSGCGKLSHMKEHDEYCSVGKAEAAIAKGLKALEGV